MDSNIDFNTGRRAIREISLIPLINIIFLLLIYFMIAGTVERFDIVPVDVPEAVSGKALQDGGIIVLLGRYDELIINDELVDIASFTPQLKALLDKNPDAVITLKADAALKATKMIDMVNRIRQAGGINLSIVTEQPR